MTTPIYDFVQNYIKSDMTRLHMPGHKGVSFLGCEEADISEIKGADALYEADGIIGESEKNASLLFGTGRTLYSAEGSSLCIRAMLCLALKRKALNGKRPFIIAARNAHKALLYACGLLDIDIKWIMPEKDNKSICSVVIEADRLEKELEGFENDKETKALIGVYITSPDYLGQMSDIRSLSAVCESRDVPLLVDNAHGAYLKFLEKSQHPMDLGAYMCADSAHKTLPALTGSAYLHLSEKANEEVGDIAKAAMMMFGSTSPSYLILESLDLCNKYLESDFRKDLLEMVAKIDRLKEELEEKGIPVFNSTKHKCTDRNLKAGDEKAYLMSESSNAGFEISRQTAKALNTSAEISNSSAESLNTANRESKLFYEDMNISHEAELNNKFFERGKLTIHSSKIGLSGYELADRLREKNIEPEFADEDFVVLMFTPRNSAKDFERVREVLSELPQGEEKESVQAALFLELPEKKMSIRGALLSKHIYVSVKDAVGRVCGEPSVSCPPAVPIAVCGEVITESMCRVFEAYNIERIAVVAD